MAEKQKPRTRATLTGKQAAFVDYYLGNARFNASQAARMAGYAGEGKALWAIASQTLGNPSVAAAIKERLSARAMGADECLARLAEHARADIADVIELIPGGVDRDKWVEDLVQALRHGQVSVVDLLLKDEPRAPGWRVSLEKAQQLGITHLIRKVGYDKFGRPEVEMHDPQAALVQIGRHHGLFVDRQQVETPEALQLLRKMLSSPDDRSSGDSPG